MFSGSWRIARASVVGSSHIAAGTPCQDFSLHDLISTPEGREVLIAVISDGAGSVEHAAIGSSITCHSFIALVRRFVAEGGDLSSIDRTQVQGWIKQLAEALERRASDSGHDVRDYACTLLATILSGDVAAFLQIGDGAIVVTSHGEEEDEWSWIFWPQKGPFANTTNFVVSKDALQVLEFELAPRRIDEIAMFTDGLEGLVLHHKTKTVHDPFFNAVMKPLRSLMSDGFNQALSEKLELYLSLPAFCERTDDDKTLLLASRRWDAERGSP